MFKFLSKFFSVNEPPTPIISKELTQIILDSPETLIQEVESNKYTDTFIKSAQTKSTDTLLHEVIHAANRAKHSPDKYQLYLSLAHLLLQRGADPNNQNHRGYTPIMYATRFLLIDMVQSMLTHADCDLTLTSEKGSTARSMLDHYNDDARVDEIKALLDNHSSKIPPL